MTASTLIDSTPTAAELEASTILSWRCEELCRAGYEPEDALLLAITPHVDLHVATDLVTQGCKLLPQFIPDFFDCPSQNRRNRQKGALYD